MVESHVHKKASRYGNPLPLHIAVDCWNMVGDSSASADMYTEAYGGTETTPAWLAVLYYIVY